MATKKLTVETPCMFLSADCRRELEEQVLDAGTRIRKDARRADGTGYFQASPDGVAWYNYRA